MTKIASLAELIGATSRLIELLDREVEALQSGKPQALNGLAVEKTRLMQAYEASLAGLRKDAALFKAAAPAIKDEVVSAAMKLDRAIQRNMRALDLARGVNQRLIETIVDAATREKSRGRGYSMQYGAALPASPRRAEAVSIAFDQRL
jgi:flagellar biosynthesis/type III secretory pathway chaperone